MPAVCLQNDGRNPYKSSGSAFNGVYWRLVNYEALNRYVLIAIALFAVLLYIGLVYAGFAEFMKGMPRRAQPKKHSRNRREARGLRNAKRSG
jgi:hypothetical protein